MFTHIITSLLSIRDPWTLFCSLIHSFIGLVLDFFRRLANYNKKVINGVNQLNADWVQANKKIKIPYYKHEIKKMKLHKMI